MAYQTEPRSGIVYGWTLGENNWKDGMDANLLWLGRFGTHLSIKDRDLSAPPGSPVAGDTYIVATGGTGDWTSKDGQVAVWNGSAWVFGVPRVGWLCYVEDEDKLIVRRSAGWSAGIAM